MAIFDLLFGVVFAGAGLYIVFRAVIKFWNAFKIKRSETVPVREAAKQTGTGEFEGVVEATNEYGTFEAPFSGAEAVLSTYEVERRERRRSSRRSGSRTTWKTEATGELTQPFLVSDGSGCVEVDPTGAEIAPTNSETRHETGSSLPNSVRLRLSVLTDRLDLDDVLAQNKSKTRRYSAGYIEPGDAVHIFGTQVADQTPSDPSVDGRVENAEGERLYRISAGTEADTIQGHAIAGVVYLILGLIFVGVGAFVILNAFVILGWFGILGGIG